MFANQIRKRLLALGRQIHDFLLRLRLRAGRTVVERRPDERPVFCRGACVRPVELPVSFGIPGIVVLDATSRDLHPDGLCFRDHFFMRSFRQQEMLFEFLSQTYVSALLVPVESRRRPSSEDAQKSRSTIPVRVQFIDACLERTTAPRFRLGVQPPEYQFLSRTVPPLVAARIDTHEERR